MYSKGWPPLQISTQRSNFQHIAIVLANYLLCADTQDSHVSDLIINGVCTAQAIREKQIRPREAAVAGCEQVAGLGIPARARDATICLICYGANGWPWAACALKAFWLLR